MVQGFKGLIGSEVESGTHKHVYSLVSVQCPECNRPSSSHEFYDFSATCFMAIVGIWLLWLGYIAKVLNEKGCK
jgi:hypothetical protein